MITVTPLPISINANLQRQLLKDALRDAIEEVGKGVLQDYKSTTETWDTKPRFYSRTKVTADYVERYVYTKSDIYRWVHDGTERRYAVLSSDFQPKTIPGALASFPGRGGVIRFDYSRPQPGIIARNFTDSIIIKRQGRMAVTGQRHLGKAVRNSGFAYP